MICLCRYHNLVAQGASLLNLGGLTPTKRQNGWHRAGKFWKFCVSKSSEMALSKTERVPKNFEQFQTCDFPHRLRKLTKNRRLVNFFKEIRFFWQTQFDCLHKYHFYIKSMQDSTKNSKYAKSIYRSV